MALPSSGEIKISDILTEAGLSATLDDTSLGALEAGSVFTINTANPSTDYPDGSAPASISEWYGYDHNASTGNQNLAYWQFSNSGEGLRFDRASGTSFTTGSDICISFWIRPEWASTDTNALMFEMSPNTTSTNDRFFLLYDFGLNRFVARHRSNGTNSRGTHWNLQSNNTQTGTGSSKWSSSNVGNVNTGGLAHIVLTYDASASSGSAAFDCYWNGVKMPNKLTNLTSTITAFDIEDVFINRSVANTNSSREARYDNVAVFHNKMLTQSEITSLYNSGASSPPEDVALDDNVMFVFDTENDPPTAQSGTDFTTTWSLGVDKGRSIAY
jgi:hypothetical protein